MKLHMLDQKLKNSNLRNLYFFQLYELKFYFLGLKIYMKFIYGLRIEFCIETFEVMQHMKMKTAP